MADDTERVSNMQLILLSGGSGKRLWPLSNNARSKQFLPLLEKPGGGMESMVQRIVRQISESGLSEDITVSTNASQLDNITNQLGDKVSVVTEPERRGTFPAISLAASYLHSEKGCPLDEVVAILPCDAYTTTAFFKTVARMAKAVEDGKADLVLMGITPALSSPDNEHVELDRFGYALPAGKEDEDGTMILKRFVEKPSEEIAEQMIANGAFWNGGVFACRLGYILDAAGKYATVKNYSEMRAGYVNLPAISFDCEVVETAGSLAVVPFHGDWKDLGSWNSLTSELHTQVIGNAVLGNHCHNTHVINELQIPLFVDGLKDAVVASCPDGILVCAKQVSGFIKRSVSGLTPRPMYEERRWGTYRVLDDTKYQDGNHSLTKSITLHPGKNISFQLHHHRSETWTFVEGEGIFVLDGKPQKVKAGETVYIPVEHWHAIKALTQLTFIEVQCGNPLIEEDIERDYSFDWSKVTK